MAGRKALVSTLGELVESDSLKLREMLREAMRRHTWNLIAQGHEPRDVQAMAFIIVREFMNETQYVVGLPKRGFEMATNLPWQNLFKPEAISPWGEERKGKGKGKGK
jgi:hypothetical protein